MPETVEDVPPPTFESLGTGIAQDDSGLRIEFGLSPLPGDGRDEDLISVTMQAHNDAVDHTLHDVRVLVPLPSARLQLVEVLSAPPARTFVDDRRGFVEWVIPALPPRRVGQQTLIWRRLAQEPFSIQVGALAMTADDDPSVTGAMASVPFARAAPQDIGTSVDIGIAQEGAPRRRADGSVELLFAVENHSRDRDAHGVRLTGCLDPDALPLNVALPADGHRPDEQCFIAGFPFIPAGARAYFGFRMRLHPSADERTVLHTRIVVAGDEIDGVPENNWLIAETPAATDAPRGSRFDEESLR